jgi:hypothetical protein
LKQLAVDIRSDSANRVNARIGEAPYYIEADIAILPYLESVLSSAFFAAMAGPFDVTSAVPADQEFVENNKKVVEIASRWWGWPARNPFAVTTATERRAISPKAALFFTGGVDSFCSLLRHPTEISGLIHVHGFDIPLDDVERYVKARTWIEAVGRKTGIQTVYVATDIRQNDVFCSVNWEISHGAALACIAHVLADSFSHVFLASSDVPPPWGSNEALDPLWSSSRMKLTNDGWNLSRLEKVKFISGSSLVHRHLKVCWENGSSELNCGGCEKCVRTQGQFAVAGTLDRLEVFPSGSLESRIDGISDVHGELRKQWRDIHREIGDANLAAAIRRLLERSESRDASQ